MAARRDAYAGNAPGDVYVDRSCIDCDTCRQIAPLTFIDADGHALVAVQPEDADQLRAAARAVLCCPTTSIGTARAGEVRDAINDFPLPLGDGVSYCGFTAAASYGASSYLIRRPAGNWLIDAPRWQPQLAARIAMLGGISGIIYTHRDDVADGARYAQELSARQVIHAADRDAAPLADVVISGDQPMELGPGLVVLPVPGHTAGSVVVLVDQVHAFTGDHVWFSRRQQRLVASRAVCWYSWEAQTRSMALLATHPFRRLFPGHGSRHDAGSADAMRIQLDDLVGRMRSATPASEHDDE